MKWLVLGSRSSALGQVARGTQHRDSRSSCEGGGGGCLSGGDGGGGGEEEEQLGVPCVRSLLSFIANQLGNLLGVPGRRGRLEGLHLSGEGILQDGPPLTSASNSGSTSVAE